MKIQIIGVGAVGSAQAYLASKLGHEVIGFDPGKTTHQYARIVPEMEKDADITFICTPETFVGSAVDNFVRQGAKGLLVIKSTVPSGTTRELTDRYQMHICHNPEFLREKTAYEDILHPHFVAIGQCCDIHCTILKEFYKPLGCPIVSSQPTVTETVKLTLNAYLSTLISFWNEIDKLAKALNISTDEVANIVKFNPRVSAYGTEFFGSPFGGKCLPKDLDQILSVYNKLGAEAFFFAAVKEFNKRV